MFYPKFLLHLLDIVLQRIWVKCVASLLLFVIRHPCHSITCCHVWRHLSPSYIVQVLLTALTLTSLYTLPDVLLIVSHTMMLYTVCQSVKPAAWVFTLPALFLHHVHIYIKLLLMNKHYFNYKYCNQLHLFICYQTICKISSLRQTLYRCRKITFITTKTYQDLVV